MNIIFIGQLYDNEQLEKFTALGSQLDIAAHTFQEALLSGINPSLHDINVISSPYVSCYPFIKLLKIKDRTSQKYNTTRHSVSFINIPGIKHISKTLSIRKKIKQLISDGRDYHIVVYSMHSPFLLSILGLNKRHKTCLVVPDLPEYMSEKKNVIYKIAKKIDRFIINYCLKRIDSYILFSPLMTERLNIQKPFDIIEGIYNSHNDIPIQEKEQNTTIMYSGNLDSRYGIMMLLDAFRLINDENYRLWICGAGNSVEKINEYAKFDNRIKYLGMLPHKDVLILQRKATILVNPRSSGESYTRYSFPSKTMEYLASGTPTIMSHLASIPVEYDKHIIYVEDETAEGLKDKILMVGSLSEEERTKLGTNASEFIIKNKNSHTQANKLLTLLSNL